MLVNDNITHPANTRRARGYDQTNQIQTKDNRKASKGQNTHKDKFNESVILLVREGKYYKKASNHKKQILIL